MTQYAHPETLVETDWLAEHAKIPVLILPFTVGGSDKAKDLFGLFDDSIARLLAVK